VVGRASGGVSQDVEMNHLRSGAKGGSGRGDAGKESLCFLNRQVVLVPAVSAEIRDWGRQAREHWSHPHPWGVWAQVLALPKAPLLQQRFSSSANPEKQWVRGQAGTKINSHSYISYCLVFFQISHTKKQAVIRTPRCLRQVLTDSLPGQRSLM